MKHMHIFTHNISHPNSTWDHHAWLLTTGIEPNPGPSSPYNGHYGPLTADDSEDDNMDEDTVLYNYGHRLEHQHDDDADRNNEPTQEDTHDTPPASPLNLPSSPTLEAQRANIPDDEMSQWWDDSDDDSRDGMQDLVDSESGSDNDEMTNGSSTDDDDDDNNNDNEAHDQKHEREQHQQQIAAHNEQQNTMTSNNIDKHEEANKPPNNDNTIGTDQ